jgi:hypothetical protein
MSTNQAKCGLGSQDLSARSPFDQAYLQQYNTLSQNAIAYPAMHPNQNPPLSPGMPCHAPEDFHCPGSKEGYANPNICICNNSNEPTGGFCCFDKSKSPPQVVTDPTICNATNYHSINHCDIPSICNKYQNANIGKGATGATCPLQNCKCPGGYPCMTQSNIPGVWQPTNNTQTCTSLLPSCPSTVC